MSRKPALKLTEADVALACVQLLEYDGWRHLRTDPCSDRARGKGFGEKGMADSLFLRYDPNLYHPNVCEYLWIEWKRPKKFVIGSHQYLWHAAERKRGAVTLIAGVEFEPTFDGFKIWYQNSGLQRRRDAKTA